jgi:tRNA1(Val) A37 N6-methylase TrmN6
MAADPAMPRPAQESLRDKGGQADLATTVDAFLGGRLSLRQPAEGYRAAIDPVLLAASVSAAGAERIVDLGCGIGTAGLCLLARLPKLACAGIDLQAVLVDLARSNAAANHLADRYQAQAGSILDRDLMASFVGADQVIANPPYLPKEEASPSAHPIKALANVESDAVLADWVAVAAATARSGGVVTFIHRADRLPELLALMRNHHLGSLVILPIQPKAGVDANRVILRGHKGKKAPARLLPPFTLHESEGRYTAQAQAVLRDAGVLSL